MFEGKPKRREGDYLNEAERVARVADVRCVPRRVSLKRSRRSVRLCLLTLKWQLKARARDLAAHAGTSPPTQEDTCRFGVIACLFD